MKNSKIEWTHHTFNPWWGCTKVSAACKHCYAEAWAKRTGHDVWGGRTQRRFFSDKHWSEPLKWNKDAKAEGSRHRVFCASMADVFERRKELNPWRERLWALIEDTPWLDWLLLTKRAEQLINPWGKYWHDNVWLGVTAENQHWADKRIPLLVKQKAKVKFISAEPLLGALDITTWLDKDGLDWVIVGGESGANSRPMNPVWLEALLKQCHDNNTAFHFKQWGHWSPTQPTKKRISITIKDNHGDDITLWALGKRTAGRLFNNQTYDGLP